MPAERHSATAPSSAAGPDGQQPLPADPLSGPRLGLAPVAAEHVDDLRRILATPEVRRWWGDEAASPEWPFDDPSTVRYALLSAGSVVGMIQYWEEHDPMYRHASIDIFLDPSAHSRGLGREAVRVLAAHLIGERHHHRLVIDPAASNRAAIRCYEAVGFRPVGVMRRYERVGDGEWHDGLLMDLLAEEFIGETDPHEP